MKDDLFVFSTVAFVKGKDNLGENSPYKILPDELWLLWVSTLFYQMWQITTFAVLHHQVDRSLLLIHKFVIASNDIVCFHFSQNFDFVV